MSTLRYPLTVLASDYVRAGIGAAACLALLLGLDAGWWVRGALLAVLAACAALAVQALRRQRARVSVDAEAIAVMPGPGRVRWSALERVRLAYYSVRGDRARGWWELRVDGDGRCLVIDSRLHGFDSVVRAAALAAARRGLALDRATAANLSALGIEARGPAGNDPGS